MRSPKELASEEEGYSWLDDPFDEKKAAQDTPTKATGAWVGLGCGCVFALALLAFAAISVFGALSLVNG